MRGGSGGGGAPPTDQTANFFWTAILIIGGVILLWWYDYTIIMRVVFAIRTAEFTFMRWIADIYNYAASSFGLPTLHTAPLSYWLQRMSTVQLTHTSYRDLEAVSQLFGRWYRFPIAVILFAMAIFLYLKHGSTRFTRTFNIKSLRQAEVNNWPSITPVTRDDLLKNDINKGPWAMSILPLDFAKKYELLMLGVDNNQHKIWQIKRGPSHRVFVMQLGPLWRAPLSLPSHIQALLAVFILRAKKQHDAAHDLLDQISRSASGSGQLDFTGVREIIVANQNAKILKWVTSRHAYINTVMMTMLDIARTDGVLASSEFLWLKPVDRRMWYCLNSVGRKTAVPEIAGVFAHWRAEKKVGRALRVPMVKEAINALELAVQEVLFVNEEDQWQANVD